MCSPIVYLYHCYCTFINLYVGFPFFYICSFICTSSGSFVPRMNRQKPFFLNCKVAILVREFILKRQNHCRQRAPVGIVLSSSGTSQLGMFDIQATTKCKYYDHIVLLYLESRRCRYRSIIFACFYLYVSVVSLIDYSDIDK